MSISAVTASDDINATHPVLTDSNDDIKLDEINNQPTDIEDDDSIPEAKKITTTQDDETKHTTVDSTININKSKSKIGTDEKADINTKKSQKNTFEDGDDKKIKLTSIDTNPNKITLNNENKQVKSNITTDINARIQNLENKINETLTKIKTITDKLDPEKLNELNNTLTDLKNNIEKTITEAKEKYNNTEYEKEILNSLEAFYKEINSNITEIQNKISNTTGKFDEIKTETQNKISNTTGKFDEIKTETQNKLNNFLNDVNAGIKFIKDVKEIINPLFKNNSETKQNSASSSTSETKQNSASKTKPKISLTLKNIKTLSKNAKKVVITAKLKINGKIAKNKKVTFIFKGKKYVRKTNKKGIATLTINKATIKKLLKKVKPGKKVTYQVKYDKNIVKKSFKVKK